tara:strand:+ start:53 stop:313 length:261 start_codon:yes stop_codon:yes gene_type:complete
MAKNLTEEELKSIQDINQRFMNTKVAIADAVVSQTKMIDALDTIQAEFRDLEKGLTEKYGENATIDLRTGEVKDPEPVEEKEEKKK